MHIYLDWYAPFGPTVNLQSGFIQDPATRCLYNVWEMVVETSPLPLHLPELCHEEVQF